MHDPILGILVDSCSGVKCEVVVRVNDRDGSEEILSIGRSYAIEVKLWKGLGQ